MNTKTNLLLIVLGLTLLSLSCNKSNDSSGTIQSLKALTGTWKVKSSRCYQNPNIIFAISPDAYYKFNSNFSGVFYEGSITNHYSNFTYNILGDGSTLIINTSTSGAALFDTSVITTLTPSQLIFHGINTYAHGFSLCINGNGLDSLYR